MLSVDTGASAHSDFIDYLLGFNRGKRHSVVRTGAQTSEYSEAFQAYDEGLIPFTRSNSFKYLRHAHRAILTSSLPTGRG